MGICCGARHEILCWCVTKLRLLNCVFYDMTSHLVIFAAQNSSLEIGKITTIQSHLAPSPSAFCFKTHLQAAYSAPKEKPAKCGFFNVNNQLPFLMSCHMRVLSFIASGLISFIIKPFFNCSSLGKIEGLSA